MRRATPLLPFGLTFIVLLAGCGEDLRPVLVALRGCGLDSIELSGVEVVPRGDFPETVANGRVVTGGRSGIDDLPDDTVALTIEGKFADATLAVGRTSRLENDERVIAIYFAPEDALCAVERGTDVAFRDVGAIAVGPEGDIVMIGGRDPDGRILDDIVHTRDVDKAVTRLPRPIPSPTTGLAVVPVGARRFAAIAGATADGRVLDQLHVINLDDPSLVGPAIRIDGPGIDGRRSYHAAVPLLDGRTLVSGGCTSLDLTSRCSPTAGHVLSTAFFIDARSDPPTFERAPSMIVSRFAHELLLARDGTVFAVGGRNHLGRGVVTIERLATGGGDWVPYGRTDLLQLGGERSIVGAALLEGGLIVVAADDGSIAWITDAGAGWWSSWCDGDPGTPGCFYDETGSTVLEEQHSLITLPGERLYSDAWLLPFPMLSSTAADAVDLSEPRPGQLTPPPGRRRGSAVVGLADGTVFVAGGRERESPRPAQPLLARLRPRLDGPDERIPDVAGLAPASFVLHAPDRITLDADRLLMTSDGAETEFPSTWAHVRSFRSARFRFDVEIAVMRTQDAGPPPRPHLVLSQGAIAGTSIRFDAGVSGFRRDASGRVATFSCSASSVDFESGDVPLRIDVQPEAIVLRQGGQIVGNCPGAGDVPSAIGIGVSGNGILTATSPLLTRK